MKKRMALILTAVLMLALAACGREPVENEQPPLIMAAGELYRYTDEPLDAEVEEDAVIGYTTSYTDFIPETEGEINFSHELDLPYASVEGGVAILLDGEWYLCVKLEN